MLQRIQLLSGCALRHVCHGARQCAVQAYHRRQVLSMPKYVLDCLHWQHQSAAFVAVIVPPLTEHTSGMQAREQCRVALLLALQREFSGLENMVCWAILGQCVDKGVAESGDSVGAIWACLQSTHVLQRAGKAWHAVTCSAAHRLTETQHDRDSCRLLK